MLMSFPSPDCEDTLQTEIVWGTSVNHNYLPQNVLSLKNDSKIFSIKKKNYWLAENGREGQGFTMKVSSCRKAIAGVLIKNTRHGHVRNRVTKSFRVTGQVQATGPWEVLVENGQLENELHKEPEVIPFYFSQPVAVKYLRFELLDYWGEGGGLQYFYPIPVAGNAF